MVSVIGILGLEFSFCQLRVPGFWGGSLRGPSTKNIYLGPKNLSQDSYQGPKYMLPRSRAFGTRI